MQRQGKMGTNKQRCGKVPGPFILFILTLFLLAPGLSQAGTINQYGTYASWPADGSWIPIPSLNDPDDGVTAHLDFVGDTNNPCVYHYSNGTYLFFRIRVDEGTIGVGTFSDSILILIDYDRDGTVDYGFAWDSKGTPISSHGLEMLVPDTEGTTWGNTKMDDIDGNNSSKIAPPDFKWLEQPGATDGYVRTVDNQNTTNFGTTSFIDFAVKCSYLSAPATPSYPDNLLRCDQTWKIQVGSIANATDHNNITEDVAGNSTPDASPKVWSAATSTLINLATFTAKYSSGNILLEWETVSEIDNAGFHIWRSDTANGTYSRITTTLIPAEGGATSGHAYDHTDTAVTVGHTYFYKLEAIDNSGVSEFFGPVSAAVNNPTPVPTLSEWGMIVFFLILGTGAVLALRRRRTGIDDC